MLEILLLYGNNLVKTMQKKLLNNFKLFFSIFFIVALYFLIALLIKKTGINKNNGMSPILSPNLSTQFIKNSEQQPEIRLSSAEKGKEEVSATMKMDNTASKSDENNNQVTFSNVQPNTDAIYKKITNGIKEEILLHKKPESQPIYNFVIEAEGMTIQMFEGQYYFFDEQGFARFTIPKPFMVDAGGDRSDSVFITVDKTDKGYKSTVSPDISWLTSPDRKYPVIIDPSLVVPEKAIREIFEKRTIGTKTYDLGNGIFAAVGSLEALHYKDKDGSWKEIDTTIVSSSDPEYNYMNITNNFQTYFSTDGFGNKKSVKYVVGDSYMKFNFVGGKGKGSKNNAKSNVFNFSKVYQDGENEMDADYTLYKDKLLEEVVLNKFQGYPNLKQEVELKNVYLKQEDKEIYAYNSNTNELVWIIPRPVMYELGDKSETNYGLHYEIQKKSNDTITLEKVIDQEGKDWLSNKDRKYPIVIDITAAGPNNPGTIGEDTSVGTNGWSNLNNAMLEDGTVADTGLTLGVSSYYLKASNFSFSISNGSTIKGVKAEAKQMNANSLTTAAGGSMKLVNSSGSLVGDSKYCPFLSVLTYCSNGGQSDMWGSSWTPSDINDPDFGFAEYANQYDAYPTEEQAFPQIDHMRLTVYYSPPEAIHLKGLKIRGIKIQ